MTTPNIINTQVDTQEIPQTIATTVGQLSMDMPLGLPNSTQYFNQWNYLTRFRISASDKINSDVFSFDSSSLVNKGIIPWDMKYWGTATSVNYNYSIKFMYFKIKEGQVSLNWEFKYSHPRAKAPALNARDRGVLLIAGQASDEFEIPLKWNGVTTFAKKVDLMEYWNLPKTEFTMTTRLPYNVTPVQPEGFWVYAFIKVNLITIEGHAIDPLSKFIALA